MLVLLEDPTFPGCWVEVRAVGVFWMEDEKGPTPRSSACPRTTPATTRSHDIDDLPPRLLDEIEHFFDVYKMLEPEKNSTTRGYEGRDAAYARDRGVEVAVPELGVGAAALQQLVVGAGLDDPAVVDHHDPVGGARGLQAVGDQQRGAVA